MNTNVHPLSSIASVAHDNESNMLELDRVLNSFMPHGYKFLPDDVELIKYYLQPKIAGFPIIPGRIHDVDVYKYSPEDLSDAYKREGEQHTYFFTPRYRKYANGNRPNRAVGGGFGFWKASAKDSPIKSDGIKIGSKMTLVFFQGKPKDAVKTNWIMQEFTLKEKNFVTSSQVPPTKLDDWVLCKIYKNNRGEKKNQSRDQVVVAPQVQPNEAMMVPPEVAASPQFQPNQAELPNEVVAALQVFQPNQNFQTTHHVQAPLISENIMYQSSFPSPPSLPVAQQDMQYDPSIEEYCDYLEQLLEN